MERLNPPVVPANHSQANLLGRGLLNRGLLNQERVSGKLGMAKSHMPRVWVPAIGAHSLDGGLQRYQSTISEPLAVHTPSRRVMWSSARPR